MAGARGVARRFGSSDLRPVEWSSRASARPFTLRNIGIKARLRTVSPGVQGMLRGVLVHPVRAYFRHVPGRVGKSALWRLASHTWWLETDVDAATEFGATIRVNARDIVGRYIYYFGVWEPNLTAWLRATLKPGDVFVDVGANVGYFTLLASQLVGTGGTVVAVEAVPSTAETLRANALRNRTPNVRVVNAAAWKEEAILDLFFDPEQTTGTATVNEVWAERWGVADGRISVVGAPLTTILSEQELSRARVVKIDVEGAELAALQGLVGGLGGNDEVEVVVEVAPGLLEAEGGSWDELANLMASHGFRPRVIENNYSASAYWSRTSTPRFLDQPPRGSDQFDVIFTRAP